MSSPSVKYGKDAWKYTIYPSHRLCKTQLKIENKGRLVNEPTGLPDFIVHDRKTKFYELKPNRLFSKTLSPERRYLSEDQEKVIKKMLKDGMKNIFIVYYNKYKIKGHSKNGRFVFKKQRLTKKNLKLFCLSYPYERYDPDKLFKRISK